MMEDYEQNENRLASARIHPKKVDVLLVSNLFLVCAVALVLRYLGIVHIVSKEVIVKSLRQTKTSLRRNAGGSILIIYLFLISVFMRRL